MDEPQGLDQFVSSLQAPEAAPSPQGGPAPASVQPESGEPPEGLDDYVDSLKQEQYGSTGQQIITGLEGAAQGVAGPLAPLVETKLLGVKPEDIRERAEANPWTHGLSEGAGFVGGAFLGTSEARVVGAVGEGAAALAGLGEATSVGARLAQGAVKLGAEMGTIQALDEGTKAITEDPNQSIGSAVSNIGLSTLLGGATGGLFKGVGMLGKVGLEKSGFTGEALQEFKDRLAYRSANLDPHQAIQKELSDAVGSFHDIGSEIGGATGVKTQALEKIMPEAMTPEISGAVQSVSDKAQAAMSDMVKQGVPESYVRKFQSTINDFLETATSPESSVMDHFEAMNSLKKDLADFSKGNYGPFAVPSYKPEYDFLKVTKSLGHDIKLTLEDPKVWGGDIADLQKNINAAWSKAIPAVKDIEGKFMTRVGGSPEIDPQKFTTYLNQAGKSSSSTIRQQMMGNFVDAMEKFHSAMGKAYEKAGLEAPELPGMSELKQSLQRPSVGARLADAWYDKMAGKVLGISVGTGVGGTLGHATGIPGAGYVGTIIGERIGESVLPAFIQPLLEKAANHSAFESAVNFGKNVIKGDTVLTKAARGVFSGAEILPKQLMPTGDRIEKLDGRLKLYQKDPKKMFDVSGDLGHYMPGHAQALSQTAMQAVNYLNAQRPSNPKQSPLDSDLPVSAGQKAAFTRTLEVAQQPLVVMDHIKGGTLLPSDVATIKTIYPAFYGKMSQMLMSEMTNHLSKGENIPYRSRQGISLFLGQPMDSTMLPQSIASAQAVFARGAQPQQAGPQGSGAKGSPSKLANTSNRYLTAEQAATSRRSSSKV